MLYQLSYRPINYLRESPNLVLLLESGMGHLDVSNPASPVYLRRHPEGNAEWNGRWQLRGPCRSMSRSGATHETAIRFADIDRHAIGGPMALRAGERFPS